ncbi:MAG TPA: hypothetical protein VGC87_26305 [Pyrinomonadaceae bacterium]|jgi:hypothetical protein
MLSRKQTLIAALGLLIALTAVTLSQQDQQDQQQQKKRKDKEIPTQTGPAPVVQIADHARVVTPCPDSAADSQVPLSVTVQNFSDPSILRYNWRASGGRIVGDGPSATWDLSGAAPGTYQATIEVDNNQNNGCTAFTTTKVIVRECIRPPVCPNVSIYCPDTVSLGAPVTFSASLSGGYPANVSPVYNWTVSNGTVISGQGTASIQVDTTGLEGQTITANLSVEGYNQSCTATCTVNIPRKIKCQQVDYYPPIRYNDEKARLDNFAVQLQNDPNAKGHIIVFGGPKSNTADKQKRIKRAYDYLVNFRGISPDRLVTKDGGPRDETTTELWIVPLGATDCP